MKKGELSRRELKFLFLAGGSEIPMQFNSCPPNPVKFYKSKINYIDLVGRSSLSPNMDQAAWLGLNKGTLEWSLPLLRIPHIILNGTWLPDIVCLKSRQSAMIGDVINRLVNHENWSPSGISTVSLNP